MHYTVIVACTVLIITDTPLGYNDNLIPNLILPFVRPLENSSVFADYRSAPIVHDPQMCIEYSDGLEVNSSST